MNTIIWIMLSFLIGAIVGRYFEKIRDFLYFMRSDIQRVQEQTRASIENAKAGVTG